MKKNPDLTFLPSIVVPYGGAKVRKSGQKTRARENQFSVVEKRGMRLLVTGLGRSKSSRLPHMGVCTGSINRLIHTFKHL